MLCGRQIWGRGIKVIFKEPFKTAGADVTA
jgi:hypothetical protein